MSIEFQPQRLILAIGGSKHLQWVPDMGPTFIVPLPTEVKFKEYTGDLDELLEAFEMKVENYKLERLGYGKARKDIYVMEMYDGDPVDDLKHWLLERFIQMEDPIDSD